ncbi:MAG: phytanoyl-CoA dioxygenase, partial [Asticcacaulis sp.]
MPSFKERLKTRVPDWRRFVTRARDDPRAVAYDLLPVLGLPERDGLTKTVAALKPKTPGFQPSDKAREFDLDLRNNGITAMQGPLAADVQAGMLSYFQQTPCHDPYRPHLGAFAWDQPPSDEVNLGYYTWEEVIRAPGLLELVNSPDVLEAAELYFGCKPVIDNIGASWAYPGREVAKGAQRFHRDYDCARSFKLFLYLTDVDDDSGPHVYVRGSHRRRELE